MDCMSTLSSRELHGVTGGAYKVSRICASGDRLYEDDFGQVYTKSFDHWGPLFTKRAVYTPVGKGKTVNDICPAQ